MTEINIFISVGELFDRYSILLIKQKKILNKDKLEYIKREIDSLQKYVKIYDIDNNNSFKQILEINSDLWNIEDKIRIKEQNLQFDAEFIELARNVYKFNDKRANIKLNINKEFNSYYREIKEFIN